MNCSKPVVILHKSYFFDFNTTIDCTIERHIKNPPKNFESNSLVIFFAIKHPKIQVITPGITINITSSNLIILFFKWIIIAKIDIGKKLNKLIACAVC